MEEQSNYFGGKGGDFHELGHFLPFMVGLRIVMVLVGVSFSLLMYYNECIMRFKVYWKLISPPPPSPSYTYLILIRYVMSSGYVSGCG